ncbi:unnamed protein product [Cylicostephanus goldi]|uniref:Glucose-methanol-choline oxidoreductase N-terminal domain-containing protein n=1 Tax=Cylicostephanus goldi TaxID=71465 RepID=A0A3P7N1H9_CYLGO|nr:unnamed protein product [Cylicostephanus goldi]
MPAALMYNLCHDRYNWFYHTVAQKNLQNRVFYWPRGRVWGGSSTLNAMVWIRGHPFDYDRWEKEDGAKGWNFANCLPYFKRCETYSHSKGPNDPYRGHDGPQKVMRGMGNHPLHQAFLECGKTHHIGTTEDVNGYKQEGLGYFDQSIHKGVRSVAVVIFLSSFVLFFIFSLQNIRKLFYRFIFLQLFLSTAIGLNLMVLLDKVHRKPTYNLSLVP